jgi:hypothetical protein
LPDGFLMKTIRAKTSLKYFLGRIRAKKEDIS